MSRQFAYWGMGCLAGTAFLLIASDNLVLPLLAWCAALLCFFLSLVSTTSQSLQPPLRRPSNKVALPEDHRLPPVSVPHREWRFHDSSGTESCSACGKTTQGGYWSPWISADPVALAYGEWVSKTDDHYCADCAQLREQAENLGIEGIAVEYAAGDLTEERRDEMLDYLVGDDEA